LVVLDELQQLLGPLDVQALTRLREFVWGMRTERSPCGLVLTFDTQLEGRLGHWAADLLHRVREQGPALRLTEVYTRDFPPWLWRRLTELGGAADAGGVSEDVLLALGQLVERPDLASGPRTVAEVFTRALAHHRQTGRAYDVSCLADDLRA